MLRHIPTFRMRDHAKHNNLELKAVRLSAHAAFPPI